MKPIEEAWQMWFLEKDLYKEFRGDLVGEIKELFSQAKLPIRVESRLKEDDSLMKKMIFKKKDYSEIRDKVGVRVIVNFLSDVTVADGIILEHFGPRIKKREDKSKLSYENEFGYQSIHYDVIDCVQSEEPLFCELQLRTECQDTWSRLEHGLSYKPETPLTRELKREINALSALLEIADRQFQHILDVTSNLPDQHPSRILSLLDRFFYSNIGAWYDSSISHMFLDGIEQLYDFEDPTSVEYGQGSIIAALERFLQDNDADIASVARQSPDIVFFWQPEIVVILERLEHRKLALTHYWEAKFPIQELYRIANAWGISLD